MATETQVKGNGHTPGAVIPSDAIPEKVKAFMGLDSLKGAFTQQQISTALEKLVEAGNEPREFIMRGHFWDRDYKNAWVRMLRKAVHFHDDELVALLMNTAAGDTSIMGQRINLLVQSVIGQYNQNQNNQGVMTRIKNGLGMGQKNNNDK